MTTLTNPRKHIFILVTFFIALSFALALLMVLSSTHTAQAAPVAGGTNVSGPIITHTTWTVAGSPYIMIDDVTVNSGITLTIEPNVTVMGELDTSLTINGHLQAIGTKQQHITFTSVLNSGANEWNALFFKSGSGQLEYAIMRYAEIGVCPVDWLSVGTSTHLVVKNSVIYSNSIGVCAENFFLNGQVVIENTVIRDNLNYAISSSTKGLPGLHMTNVLFQDNGYDRIHVQAFDTEYLIDDTILTAQPGLEGYEIYGDDFIIPVGITMTIEPGVTVMVDDEGLGGAIGVLGSLQAIGTITQPITFTSALNSGPGQWDGVGMGGNVHFDNVVYRYGNGIGVVNMAEGAMAIIENSVIENNASYPIGVEAESLHQLKISNTTFLNNNHNRIVISIDNGSLVDDVILRAYTGLEGYEVYDDYLSDRNLIVPDDITLTLEANVVMMVSEYGSVQVNGRLRTNGTPTQPVTITSSANTGPGEWAGLIFEGGEGDLQHTTVRYGETNMAVISDTAVVSLTHTHLVSGLTGLRVEAGVVTAVCSSFSQNQNDGIHVLNGGNPTVNIFSSNISGNGGAGLNNESGVLIDARYNWWGDASGPGGLGSGSGDAVWGHVSYEPWLLEPDCLPPLAETAVIYLPFVTMP